MFDFNTIENFDNHINASIPNYDRLFSLFLNLTNILQHENTCVIDYGCSTGKLLSNVDKKKNIRYIGIDTSSLLPGSSECIEFIKEDATKFDATKFDTSVVISMFFLQFLNKNDRKEMIRIFKNHVERGASLLISEKVFLNDIKIDNIIQRLHIQTKRCNFTDKEILDKDFQILHSMHTIEEDELMNELSSVGHVTKIWQSFSFCGYIVRKI